MVINYRFCKVVTILELTERLLAVPRRENAGARSANRFNYQQVWAFNHILELIEDGSDFLLLMEFHDDVIVLESTSNSETLDFYQIKTDDKPSRYLTASFITKNANKYPNKMSIAQKMIDNYSKFSSETKGVHLVSNKNYDFGELKVGDNSTERAVISLSEISDDQLKIIKKGMCQSCHLEEESCQNQCINLIYFNVSFMGLVNYEDTILGRFVNYLSSEGIESSISKTKTIFYTILGEIKRINNWEQSAQNIAELKRRKSISKDAVKRWINMLSKEMQDDSWDEIKTYLLNDGFSSFEVNRIGQQWKKYKLDSMNVDETLQSIKDEIRKIISNEVFDNSKEFTEIIYTKLQHKREVKIFPKEYLYVVIVRELFLS
ncbi:dsDNA nuclease domain-containing protein [Anaeroselena agilis]|uniref:DsDNA nuclease domain-containing protein n=1 Tax=Anaeroselena agilis TaxID=3063788 RepID=A0ABU3NZ26_9FIRM|nr:dsDNA nuclease domain-containing protein [Selenomonadales bacterium 4137-cl]